jgi:V/A-type H+/Na+-transporting ATPase subunit E
MDIRVQELLDKIKREGVDSAEAQAAKILSQAEEKRKAIIAAAEKEAKAIIEAGKLDSARSEESGKAALAQASRDLILAFRAEIEKVLAGIVKAETETAFDAEALKKVLPAILEAWAKDGRDELSVMVPEKDLAVLEAFFKDKLSSKLKAGIELKPLKNLKSGFRVAEKGGAAYYDFSAEAAASMLGAYLNSRLAAIVAEAAK